MRETQESGRMHSNPYSEVTNLRTFVILCLVLLVPMIGCRGEQKGEGVRVRTETPSPSLQSEPTESTDAIGASTSSLLDKVKQANSDYTGGSITKEERIAKGQEFEEEAWRLAQGAKALADKAAKSETQSEQKAFRAELPLFLMIYLEDLHAALTAERIALQTGKTQWNKRAQSQAKLLPSLANSIGWLSEKSISLPTLSPGAGKLPTPAAAATEKASETSPGKAKAAAPAKETTSGAAAKPTVKPTSSPPAGKAGATSTKKATGSE